MKPRIAIPLPHGLDSEYALRAIPQYERAVELSGGEPVRIPLDLPPGEIMKMIEQCDGVLLPGSKADVDPAKFGAERHPRLRRLIPGAMRLMSFCSRTLTTCANRSWESATGYKF